MSTYRLSSCMLFSAVCLLCVVSGATLVAAEPGTSFVTADAVTLDKSNPVLAAGARSFLSERDGDTASVWVFFTDKGLASKGQFDSRAAAVSIPEKAMARRAKTGADEVLFVDLPVNQSYVDQVIAAGAELRRTTRWLNGMSAKIPTDRLDDIAALPFVREIRPLATFRREPIEFSPQRPDFVPEVSMQPDVLNYGSSFNALSMIGVPAAHEQGLQGEGVTICMMDTGFRKSHEAFARHFSDGRFLGEYDFVFNDGNTANEPGIDQGGAWNHGTLIWGAVGGEKDGTLYGPAFRANFLLAKTEDIRSETLVEEDNWIAALEWADSLGADVTTTSLSYSDWYTAADYDGLTAPITLAANTAAALGIVTCNSIGNSGPSPTSMGAPADAFDIISVGAVTAAGDIASFSSRGPTADGRIKPELCAQGVGTFTATSGSDFTYGTASGTSLSCPLVAGAAALMVQARPTWPPSLIRQALMETASRGDNPDNNYGWGVVNLEAALEWGANFTADTTLGSGSLAVQFVNESELAFTAVEWDFGDGGTSNAIDPSHIYTEPGGYTVSLTIDSDYGPITRTKEHFVVVLGDSLQFVTDSSFAGDDLAISVSLINSQPLESLTLPFAWGNDPRFVYDSVVPGARAPSGATVSIPVVDRITPVVVAIAQFPEPAHLPAGSGEVLKIFFSTPDYVDGYSGWIDTTSRNQHIMKTSAPYLSYTPAVESGEMSVIVVQRGDVNYDQSIDVIDLAHFVDFMYFGGVPAVSTKASDIDRNFITDGADLAYLVDYFFAGGIPPPAN